MIFSNTERAAPCSGAANHGKTLRQFTAFGNPSPCRTSSFSEKIPANSHGEPQITPNIHNDMTTYVKHGGCCIFEGAKLQRWVQATSVVRICQEAIGSRAIQKVWYAIYVGLSVGSGPERSLRQLNTYCLVPIT